jgi:RimJ/RimL family protein N-acetyltransferase
MEHFTTSRLIARDWAQADLNAAYDIYSRDEVTRWLGEQPRRPVASLEQMQAGLDRWLERGRDQPDYGLWPLELRSSGSVVGAILLAPLPGDAGEVEIGWHLNPAHWGAGYATEGGRGVVALAFGLGQVGGVPVSPEPGHRPPRPALDRVVALTDQDNVRSQAVCRRLGMTHLGQTSEYYGETLELFELTAAAAAAA